MTSNPTTNTRVYEGAILDGEPMTIQGAVNKTLVLLLTTFCTAVFTWTQFFAGMADKVILLMWIGIIAGLILAFVMVMKPQNAKVLSLAYAVCEGLALGGLSAMYEVQFKGIVANAALSTFGALFTMLFLYKIGLIRPTQKFRNIIVTATISIAVFYLAEIILSFINPSFIVAWNSGIIGIVISSVICVVASLNFILDFEFIEQGANTMAPKYFEWYGAFSLLVTIVWLYVEMLRLIAMSSRK